MPKIIFWCVSPDQLGVPINKNSNNISIISGFSKQLFRGILDLENYSPVDTMLEIINNYIYYTYMYHLHTLYHGLPRWH